MKRWIVYWDLQDIGETPPWPLCAGHRETTLKPLMDKREMWEGVGNLVVKEVTDGVCALMAFGNCCDDPVTEIPTLDVGLLEDS